MPWFWARPWRLNYSPSEVAKHPWVPGPMNPDDLPGFFLTNSAVDGAIDWDKSDTVWGFGSDIGCARFVQLMLDLGRTGSVTREVELEGEGGFRGVAPLSCEARFWLPGSFGWKERIWPNSMARKRGLNPASSSKRGGSAARRT